MKVRVRRPTTQPRRLFLIDTPEEHEDVDALLDEFNEYMDVLFGRKDPPIDEGVMTLMEIAAAYYARGTEVEMQILEMERTGNTFKGSRFSTFRTGYLRRFIELTKKAMDLGSRRLTHAQYQAQMRGDYGGQ